MKLTILVLICAANALAGETTLEPQMIPREVTFAQGSFQLHGFLYQPPGKGRFPAVQWNHGSEKLPGDRSDLARFYVSHGFVFFVPHQHGHGRSPGDYIVDLQAKARREETNATAINQRTIELHELYLKDTLAAADWLRRQTFVDSNRIFMSGVSYGGIQTLLAAEKDKQIRGFVPFGPAAMSWAGNPILHDRLLAAIRGAQNPIFLLQATNDYNLGPSQILGAALERKAGLNWAKVYPEFGKTAQDGHGAFACRGTNLWGQDVLRFFEACAKN